MKNNTFISIIVPVYNTPVEILKSCFDSVKNQTYDDWELIVVDDGSEKDCACWIDDYCKDIQNKQVIHKKNDGVSIARNEGVKLASGEWITFLDSDNTLPLDTIEIYHNVVNSNQSENVELIIGYSVMGQRVLKNGEDIIKIKKYDRFESNIRELIEDKNELVNHLLTGKNNRWEKKDMYFADGPCGKLIKKCLIENIFFPVDLKWDEDTVWLLNVISKSKKIIVTFQIVYNAVEYIYSATRRYRPNCIKEFYDVCFAEKQIEGMFPMCKSAFAYKKFSNILLVSRLYFFHKDNITSEKQLFNEFVVFGKKNETKAVCNDVLKYLNCKSKRNFIYRFFSFFMKIGCYFFCWNILKFYCHKREK